MTAVLKQRGPSPKHKRYENEAYRRHVASQPCINCGHHETQAAHISVGNFARGMKADDWFCVPLCVPRLAPLGTMVIPGCHAVFDADQKRFAQEYLGKSIEELKAEAKTNWQQWLEKAA